MTPEFKECQRQILQNAKALSEELKEKGYRIVAGGTDTHLFLVDLRPKRLTGKIAEKSLEKVGITVNRNTIPFDPEKPRIASGIRIGTPALTTRGMKAPEMKRIAELIDLTLTNIDDEKVYETVRKGVKELCGQFPLYKKKLEEYRRYR
jgi:glycine hydroxymethyltransferase